MSSNKKKGKGFKAFVYTLAVFGGLLILGGGAAGVTYIVKPYRVDFSWQQTQTETELPADDTTTEAE